jgi:hybrid cluster-associated redox disulfide protein
MITKEMKIEEIIHQHPETVEVFKEFGLECNICSVAAYEDLAHGAGVHKVDLEELLKKLNATIAS